MHLTSPPALAPRLDPRLAPRRCTVVVAVLSGLLLVSGCTPSAQARRYSRKQAQASLGRLESPGLVIGEFALAGNAIVDGDTVKVKGLQTSLRLLAIDTEETFKREINRRASEKDFRQYLKDKRGDRLRPIKTGTPMGEEAKTWAKRFFAGAKTVRLERDHPNEIRGRYNRYLSYVFVRKNGQWVNYNVESVRAGMTPYFTKYGFSRRFHGEFVAAEKEARAAKRGIWDSTALGYGDYEERKAWWDARGKFVRNFERRAQGKDNYISLTRWNALLKLEQYMGKQVTVLATVSKTLRGDRGPSRVVLSRRMFGDIPAIFWDKDTFLATGVTQYKREFIEVTGVVGEYTNKHNGRRTLQIQVDRSADVVLSRVPGIKIAGIAHSGTNATAAVPRTDLHSYTQPKAKAAKLPTEYEPEPEQDPSP